MARINTVIGRRIRQRRLELGLSPRELATQIGISEEALTEIENGEHRPEGSLLIEIALALNVTLTHFFERD